VSQKTWFVYSNDIVSGPLDTETVRASIQSGRWSAGAFIWWKGQREWMPLGLWESQLPQLLKTETEKIQTPVWYIDVTGSPIGPLTETEMMQQLRGLQSLSRVRVWTVGMAKWVPLFEMTDVMDRLGISRRAHARAPLMGTVAISRVGDAAQPLMTRAASISVAGMGINDAQGLTKGDEVHVVLKSSEFSTPLRMKAVAVYVTPQGYAGLKFTSIHSEIQSLIYDYVKRFSPGSEAQKAA